MKSFREIVENYVDKKGVMVDLDGIDGDIPQEDLKNVYVRGKDHSSTAMDSELTKMYGANQKDVIGWFATKYNMSEGYVIQELSSADSKEFGKDAFRIYYHKGTNVVKFDLKKGKVYFIDNSYYAENDKVKWQTPMAYHRLFIDNSAKAFKKFNIV